MDSSAERQAAKWATTDSIWVGGDVPYGLPIPRGHGIQLSVTYFSEVE